MNVEHYLKWRSGNGHPVTFPLPENKKENEMSEHTPGPWIKDTGGTWREYDADSEMIMIFGPEGEGFGRVAHVYAECGGEVEANALLIAAAPCLLEALEAGLYRLKQYNYQAMERTIEKVEKAIAKAYAQ